MSQYYISNSGNDSNPGTLLLPWKTIAKVNSSSFSPGDIISFNGGQTFNDAVLSIGSSGTSTNPILVTSYGHGVAIISGGNQITGFTQNGSTGIWSAPLSASTAKPRAIWYDGQRCTRAAWYDRQLKLPQFYSVITDGFNTSASTIAGFLNGYGNQGDIEFLFSTNGTNNKFIESRIPVSGISTNVITMAPNPWANLKTAFGVQSWTTYFTGVENAYEIFVANNQAGTFYHNRGSNTLYVIPPINSVDPRSATIIVPTNETIVSQTNQNWITFTNIQFSYTTCFQPSNNDGFSEIQENVFLINNTTATPPIYPKLNPAIHVSGCTGVTFNRCYIQNIGTPGITIDGKSSNCEIVGNTFYDLSSQAIYIGDSSQIASGVAPDSINVHSNLVRNYGIEFRGASAIRKFYASNSHIDHNDVSQGAYTGITDGWGWAQSGTVPNANINGTINSNYVHDVIQSLDDGGGIYINNVHQNLLVNNNLIAGIGGNNYGLITGIYADDGNAGWNASGNVIYNRWGIAFYNSVFFNDWNGSGGSILNNTTVDSGGYTFNPGVRSTTNGNTATSPAQVGITAAIASGIALNAGLETAYADILISNKVSVNKIQSYLLPFFPTALWPLNEIYGATSFADVTGNGHTGSSLGTGVIGGLFNSLPSESSTGLTSNTTGGGITVPASADWALGTGNFSISCCIRVKQGTSSYKRIIGNYASGSNYWILSLDDLNRANLSYTGNGTYALPGLADGVWHHLVFTRNISTLTIYIDGFAQTGQGAPTSVATFGDSTKAVGILVDSIDGGGPANGSPNIDVKWMGINKGTALSSTQVMSIYSALIQYGTLSPIPQTTIVPLSTSVSYGTIYGPDRQGNSTGTNIGIGTINQNRQLSRGR